MWRRDCSRTRPLLAHKLDPGLYRDHFLQIPQTVLPTPPRAPQLAGPGTGPSKHIRHFPFIWGGHQSPHPPCHVLCNSLGPTMWGKGYPWSCHHPRRASYVSSLNKRHSILKLSSLFSGSQPGEILRTLPTVVTCIRVRREVLINPKTPIMNCCTF